MTGKATLSEKSAESDDMWVPKIVATLNGQYVKVVKFRGEYVWHQHEHEDEMFLVYKGSMRIHFRERVVELREGEFCVVPRGVQHKPTADTLREAILFEPTTTRNTGEVTEDRTIEPEELEQFHSTRSDRFFPSRARQEADAWEDATISSNPL